MFSETIMNWLRPVIGLVEHAERTMTPASVKPRCLKTADFTP
jgi:hypothetical protein